jgi:hypothetical protein
MREFKLIKAYPGSEEVGVIVKIHREGVFEDAKYAFSKGVGFCTFPSSHIEDNPEFWQEATKVDYKIIMVRTSNEHPAGHTPYNTEWEICNKDLRYWDILKVKRLSDGHIFTVGDKAMSVGLNNYPHIIKSLTISQKNIHLSREKDGIDRIYVRWSNNEGGNWLENIEISGVLFTTHDNVEIENGDVFYAVLNSNYKWCRTVAPGFTKNPERYRRFTLKENAIKFMIYNKPVLSIADIDEHTQVNYDELIKDLGETVKKD